MSGKANHQKHPLPNPKNHGGGKLQKICKGFSGGARPPYGGQAARLSSELAFCAKMGSSEREKSLHNGFFCNLVALKGGLLRGGAQCKQSRQNSTRSSRTVRKYPPQGPIFHAFSAIIIFTFILSLTLQKFTADIALTNRLSLPKK